jgi:hypothetical protein
MGCLFIILTFLAVWAIEFLATAGVIYLITLCFGFTFSWKIAFGIWLVIALLTTIYRKGVRGC